MKQGMVREMQRRTATKKAAWSLGVLVMGVMVLCNLLPRASYAACYNDHGNMTMNALVETPLNDDQKHIVTHANQWTDVWHVLDVQYHCTVSSKVPLEESFKLINQIRKYARSLSDKSGCNEEWAITFGMLTHLEQDFYYHTNYVELATVKFIAEEGRAPKPGELPPFDFANWQQGMQALSEVADPLSPDPYHPIWGLRGAYDDTPIFGEGAPPGLEYLNHSIYSKDGGRAGAVLAGDIPVSEFSFWIGVQATGVAYKAVTPEPSSLLALGSGLAGLGGVFFRRRRR